MKKILKYLIIFYILILISIWTPLFWFIFFIKNKYEMWTIDLYQISIIDSIIWFLILFFSLGATIYLLHNDKIEK